MLIIFFDIKGAVRKEFVLAGQTVNSAYYCDILRRLRENSRRLPLELWREKNWLFHHNAPSHTSLFTREYFTKKNMTIVPHPPYISVSPVEDKNERPPFGDLGRIAGGAEPSHRARVPGCI
jgi:hypothetical protein